MKVVKESRLFYAPKLKVQLGEFLLDAEESHHLIKVLRSNLGDEIKVTNGKGLLMIGDITNADKKKTVITLRKILEEKKIESQITIAISPTKSIDRFEWFLEKATEIGVERIIPFLCENSERRSIKNERLDKILVSAMKQSGRLWKPVL
ncbi:MAG: 16S rRNA (uracil1498-N3)-methyltransferase, partial [Patiriisocius sp.]